jgi:hypothetical protein
MKRLLGIAVLVGCGGSDPVDAEGTYSVGITNRENGCNFSSWTVGEMTSGIPVVITQNGSAAIAEVQGLAAIALDLRLGSHSFSGDVDGNHLDLLLAGTRSMTTGNCTYTYDGRIDANLIGDALSGNIYYTSAGNGHSDCAALECTSRQEFSGSRPPR